MDAHRALMSGMECARFSRFLATCEERIAWDSEFLTKLRTRLKQALVTDCSDALARSAAMHSRARVRDLGSGRAQVETVVLPAEEDVKAGGRPLHAWSGPLLLGAQEGDEVQWWYGGTLRQWRIEEILPQLAPARGTPRGSSQMRERRTQTSLPTRSRGSSIEREGRLQGRVPSSHE
jgi:transcription elongation GreA/GreB family factor